MSLIRYRVPFGFLFAAWYLLVARPASLQAFWISVILVTMGCWLRSWAAGYLFKGKRVAVGGPYAYIRNPLYVGSFIIGVGFCVALWRQPVPLSALILCTLFFIGFGIVYRAKTLAEEKELKTNLGPPYIAYASKVPPFLPVRGRAADLEPQRFSWELYKRNREYQCILGSLCVTAILLLKLYRA
jgi:protein-S-isoprenylcysteine O-methyltransferase Ste14